MTGFIDQVTHVDPVDALEVDTLLVTGTISGAGITSLFASPPPLGGTAPSPGAFTSLTASGLVSGAGFAPLFASPPPLGSTAPAAVAATTLTASGAVSGAGFTSLLASPPAIGLAAPAAGKFTTLITTGLFSTLGGATIGDSPTDIISFYGATPIARRAAGNNPAVPAGGTGAAAGGFDTAAHRNTFIAIVTEIQATLIGLGLMPAT